MAVLFHYSLCGAGRQIIGPARLAITQNKGSTSSHFKIISKLLNFQNFPQKLEQNIYSHKKLCPPFKIISKVLKFPKKDECKPARTV